MISSRRRGPSRFQPTCFQSKEKKLERNIKAVTECLFHMHKQHSSGLKHLEDNINEKLSVHNRTEHCTVQYSAHCTHGVSLLSLSIVIKSNVQTQYSIFASQKLLILLVNNHQQQCWFGLAFYLYHQRYLICFSIKGKF